MRRRNNPFLTNDDDIDSVASVANLFDVAMVFAVALMIALVTRFNMQEFFTEEDFTIVKNPGKEQMEIITKKGKEITKYKPSESQDKTESGDKGKKIGTAYQLESGEVIYIED
ncbi:DUF2149 domain-containing protein [Flammeovirga pacifica]|uniref:DUF2149 domain-containing protein n=1 Tax=Flammeovirga pacifica TaxID=915059 RepID=A0A1S1Z084_FLAPC|nr:DUF2149 domain-containing protein [Flammeovirga pacifica]OHX66661.1 hypothetical protein NH26_09965 [Flammeovirga pacifica]